MGKVERRGSKKEEEYKIEKRKIRDIREKKIRKGWEGIEMGRGEVFPWGNTSPLYPILYPIMGIF